MEADDGTQARWLDPTLVEYFIRVCVTEVHAGNRPNSHFNRLGWENVVKHFNALTGKHYTRAQLKNKWDKLKKAWDVWVKLTRQTGVGFKPNGAVDMPDSWWSDYLKENRDARCYRNAPPLMVGEQEVMFSDIRVTGDYVVYSAAGYQSSTSLDDPDETQPPDDPCEEGGPQVENSPARGTPTQQCSQSSIRTPVRKAITKSKKRARTNDNSAIARALEKVAEAVGPSREQRLGDNEKAEITRCLDILDKCHGIIFGEDLYVHAMAMFASETKRNIWLLARDDTAREAYLKYDFQIHCSKMKNFSSS